MRRSKLFWVLVVVVILMAAIFLSLPAHYWRDEEPGDNIARAFLYTVEPPTDLMPPGTRFLSGFSPGSGPEIGKVTVVEGEVFLIHIGDTAAYQAKADYPLFAGDLIVTGENARLQSLMVDKSSLSISAYTKLRLDSCIYDPRQETRSSVLTLLFGRIRCIVVRLAQSVDNDFMLETPTAVMGVRGSRFSVSVVPTPFHQASGLQYFNRYVKERLKLGEAKKGLQQLVTSIITSANTKVSFQGRTGPEYILGPYSASYSELNRPAIPPLAVTPGFADKALNVVGYPVNELKIPKELTEIYTDGGPIQVIHP